MPSPASKQPSDTASTQVTRTSSRCGTGPVAASATTAGAAGGPTTTTSSPPPSSDARHLRAPVEVMGLENPTTFYVAMVNSPHGSVRSEIEKRRLPTLRQLGPALSLGPR